LDAGVETPVYEAFDTQKSAKPALPQFFPSGQSLLISGKPELPKT
jgi:hypothetical protein